MKIILASRHGGHATRTPLVKQIIEEEVEEPDYRVITDRGDDFEYEDKVYRTDSFRPTNGKFYRPIKALKNFIKSWSVLRKEKPDEVFVYGANTGFFTGLIARLKGIDVTAVESENRTKEPSMTPSVLNRFGAKVWVSYDNIVSEYPKPELVENKKVISYRDYSDYQSDEIDQEVLAIPSSRDQEIMDNHWEYRPHEKLLAEMGKTRLVVTRAGMAAYEAANLAEEVIVRPYDHIHQKNFAEWLEENYDNVTYEREKSFRELFQEYEDVSL